MAVRSLVSRFASVCIAASGVAACAAPIERAPEVRAQEVLPRTNPQGQGAVHLGLRYLDDDAFYEPLEEPVALGVEYARRFQKGGTFGFEAGGFLASDAELGVDLLFLEGDLGLRASHDIDRFQVFAGGGIALILAQVESAVLSEDDYTIGPYVHAGAIYYVTTDFFLGVDARLVTGTEIDFPSFVETDADYVQVALLLGWGG